MKYMYSIVHVLYTCNARQVPSLFPLCSIEGVHRVFVATSDGSLHMGDIDPREGGDCKYHREFKLVGGEDVVSGPFV